MKLKTLGVILIALLAGSSLVFTATLLTVKHQFDAALKSINSAYVESVLPLRQIDANTKNLRFQLYASFMHDNKLAVSALHDHPIAFHLITIETEIKKNQLLWNALTSRHQMLDSEVLDLRERYNVFYRDGIVPSFNAAKNGDWIGIVRPISATLTNYLEFERLLQRKITSIQKVEQQRYEGIRLWQHDMFRLLFILVIFVLAVAIVLSWSTISRHSALLHDINRSLEHANLELEEKVVARTEALACANAEMRVLVDHLRTTKNKLVQAEKLVALTRLVAGVAHELNTPIGNCLLMVTTLSELALKIRVALDKGLARSTFVKYVEEIVTCCTLIESSLNKAAHIITSFKFIAIDQHNERRQKFNLATVLETVIVSRSAHLLAAHCSVNLRVPADLMLDSYPDNLAMVFNILLDNALVHAFCGRASGNIIIDAEHVHQQTVTITLSDDGIGMESDVMQRVFDPFFSTRMGQGTNGLGMTIAYNIVTGLLGGEIGVKAALPKGTIVEIIIPVDAPTGVVAWIPGAEV